MFHCARPVINGFSWGQYEARAQAVLRQEALYALLVGESTLNAVALLGNLPNHLARIAAQRLSVARHQLRPPRRAVCFRLPGTVQAGEKRLVSVCRVPVACQVHSLLHPLYRVRSSAVTPTTCINLVRKG